MRKPMSLGLRFEYWMGDHETASRVYEWAKARVLGSICAVIGHRMQYEPPSCYDNEPDWYCARCENPNLGNTLWWWLQDRWFDIVFYLRRSSP